MNQILAFLVDHMSFLWDGARSRITGSEVATSNGGDAYLVVESDRLRLRFVRDRGQLSLELQPSEANGSNDWYSVDLVRRLLLGRRETSGLLDASYASFVREQLAEIESCFSPERWETTRAELKRLARIRSREMFG